MNKEFELLLEIKKNFGWPVDTFRYGLSGVSRYWDGITYSNELSSRVKEKVRFSLEKVKIAQSYLRALARIPWIRMVFITGSVASLNAEESDDIDIWLIVDPKRIWLTRSLDFFMYVLSGKRRLSKDGVVSALVRNKFCFNFYSTTESLELSRHSISYAMQFVDAIPVFVSNVEIYKTLLVQNRWIEEYFPSWYRLRSQELANSEMLETERTGIQKFIDFYLIRMFLNLLEYIAGVLMLLKSEKKLTLSAQKVYRKQFTTWGTPRILSQYDNKTISEGS